jgi:hypothetical protein
MKRFVKKIALCMSLLLVAALFCTPVGALGTTQEKNFVSNGSVGEGIGTHTTLVDFTASDLCGFEVLGNVAAPKFEKSGAWGTPVLYSWIDSANTETGICGTLEAASLLKNADTLSIQLLAQYTKTANYGVTLKLEGTDKTGAPLSLTATATASAASWQTVTFDVSSFVAEADLDKPCTVTVLTSSNAEGEQFVLWVRSLYASTLQTYPEYILPAAAAAVGFLFGFALFMVIYRSTCKKNRPRRREEF